MKPQSRKLERLGLLGGAVRLQADILTSVL